MGSPSKERPHVDLPPSGTPPVFSLAPSTTRKHSKENVSPATENMRSPWFRKPDPQRLSQVQAEGPPLPGPEDVELGGQVAEDMGNNMICGCSKANFIIIVFFLIVLLAAAVGGGVGGSLFAAKSWARDDNATTH